MKISVLIKEPGKKPRHVYIENSLKNLQKTVGGYIEVFQVVTDLAVICNEEGKLDGLERNCVICGETFVGTIIMCGTKGDEFDDLPLSWESMKLLFPQLWEVEE